jgi:hypothetical protein
VAGQRRDANCLIVVTLSLRTLQVFFSKPFTIINNLGGKHYCPNTDAHALSQCPTHYKRSLAHSEEEKKKKEVKKNNLINQSGLLFKDINY